MVDLKQEPGKLDLTVVFGNDLSFDIDFGINLTNYDFQSIIVPSGQELSNIEIEITETDVSTGKLHLYISKESIEDLPVASNKYKWYFSWNTPQQEIPPIEVYTRTILAGFFNIIGV